MNQRGFINIIIVIFVVILIAAVGYFVFVKQSNIFKEKTSFACKYSDSELCNFIKKFTERKPYFLKHEPGETLTIDKAGNQELQIVETDGNNMRITRSKNGKEDAKLIIIGNALYKKDYITNSWKKRNISQEEIDQIDVSYYTDITENFTAQKDEFSKIAEENCGALQCLKYQVTSNIKPDDIDTMYIYFDTKEYLLRKAIVNYKDDTTQEFVPNYSYAVVEIP